MARNYKRDSRGRFSRVSGLKVSAARKRQIKGAVKTGAAIALVAGYAYANVKMHQSTRRPGKVSSPIPRTVAYRRTPASTPKRPNVKSPTRAPNGAIPMPAARVRNAGTAGSKLPTFDDLASAYSAQARHSSRYNSPNPKVAMEYASSAQYMKDILLMAKHGL